MRHLNINWLDNTMDNKFLEMMTLLSVFLSNFLAVVGLLMSMFCFLKYLGLFYSDNKYNRTWYSKIRSNLHVQNTNSENMLSTHPYEKPCFGLPYTVRGENVFIVLFSVPVKCNFYIFIPIKLHV